MNCPVCGSQYSGIYKEFPVYKICFSCNLHYQETPPVKQYEGTLENGRGPGTGHLMDEAERSVNECLAKSLYDMFIPRTLLDIGAKYPYFASVLKDQAEVLVIDAIPEIASYGRELGVTVMRADFETLDATPFKGKYDLITLIHVAEHFYDPIETLSKAVACLSHRGILYIRLPNIDVSGIHRDFTNNHVMVPPYIYSNQTMYFVADKLGCEIFKTDHYENYGQSDFYFRKKKDRPTLSVCMIVKNEEKNITDCLESIKGVADEIVIVDTGSVDKTKEVVARYTDKIFDFKWVDDFSAARNFSLSKATCDYILWADADDIFENPQEIIKELKEGLDVYNFNVLYGNEIFCHARMFRNFRSIRFSGRVHEYPIIDNSTFKKVTGVNVRHKTEKHFTEDRSERNCRILRKEIEDNPHNARALFYYGNSLKELGRYDEAAEQYRKYLGVSTWIDERWMAQKYIGQMLEAQNKYPEAIAEFTKALEMDGRWAENQYYIGECYFFLNDYQKCIEWELQAIEREMPPSPLWKEVSVYQDAPYRYLFACHGLMGDYEKALFYCQKALENKPGDSWLTDRCRYFEGRVKGDPMVIECYRQGALGDCLMTTAALAGLKERYPGCFIRYVTHSHSMQILERNKYIDELVTEPGETAAMRVYFAYPDKDSPIRNEGYPDKPLTRHLVSIFNECAGITGTYPLECTLTKDEETIGQLLRRQYGRYVTIHVKSGWSPYKDWYQDRWEAVVEGLFKMGHTTLQIGQKDDPALSNTVDFRGRTIKAAIAAMKYAEVHIGVDSFTNHASAAVLTPSVILFGSTAPTGSGYAQNVNIHKDLECSPCYREYDWSRDSRGECPYNKKCMDLITVDEVLEAVKAQLNL
jgi:ADP-heptose:LPS heptosyltransferase/glycosyltransferase involved in cell wall biosynthesis